ncbi:MAG: GNAT family N-acetyltransferase [Sporocytophaga sp.]|uniref:GNAT family N-acetyltransferase n=1 Tax=Sporocytophaga sp. TaxID=2231183 RepID=UPI001B16AA93|nr:GNAT family N-acetyltransferase [Sporocytophaga sp.]MBO9702141.1 GNAT family N-acetyltransferase [Sporocytophaga sp.]
MIAAKIEDKSLVVDILTASFDQNISVNYVVKQDGQRKARIRRLMEYCFESCFHNGIVYLSKDRNACALILFPEQETVSLKSIMNDLRLAFSCIGPERLPKVLSRESKVKSYYPKQSIFYLRFIGVHPDFQRKGIGSSLIADIVNEARTMKKPIYLETSMAENVKFYKNMGFELFNELHLPHQLFLFRISNV